MKVSISVSATAYDDSNNIVRSCQVKVEAEQDADHSACEAYDEAFDRTEKLVKASLSCERGHRE